MIENSILHFDDQKHQSLGPIQPLVHKYFSAECENSPLDIMLCIFQGHLNCADCRNLQKGDAD